MGKDGAKEAQRYGKDICVIGLSRGAVPNRPLLCLLTAWIVSSDALIHSPATTTFLKPSTLHVQLIYGSTDDVLVQDEKILPPRGLRQCDVRKRHDRIRIIELTQATTLYQSDVQYFSFSKVVDLILSY